MCYRLWQAFIQTPLHEILDPPQEIPLENAGNGICKTLDKFQNFLGGGGCLLCFISHPLQNLLRIDKESQFLAMSNVKLILLPGASNYHCLLQILLTALEVAGYSAVTPKFKSKNCLKSFEKASNCLANGYCWN